MFLETSAVVKEVLGAPSYCVILSRPCRKNKGKVQMADVVVTVCFAETQTDVTVQTNQIKM